MNDTIEIPNRTGRHTLQVSQWPNSSRTETFDAADGQTVAFRATGKSFLPIFLASLVVPSLALQSAVQPMIHLCDDIVDVLDMREPNCARSARERARVLGDGGVVRTETHPW